jgi:phytoene dehydrogenase-like protein
LDRVTGVLESLLLLTPPNLFALSLDEMMTWGKVGLHLRGLGRRDMMEFLRILPMPIKEFLDEWFESDALKGALGASAIAGSMQGPRASGTTLTLLYHMLGQPNGGFRASAYVRGGVGQLSTALAQAAQDLGAEIRTGAAVERILLDDERATGVRLADGRQLTAKTVVSSAGPRRTFFDLIGAPELEPRFARRVRNIRFRGCTAQVNLVLSGLPTFAGQIDQAQLQGHILLSPGLDYLERAYDDAKYGRVSASPYLEAVIPTLSDPSLAPAGRHIMAIRMQYAPYHLRDGNWASQREALGDQIIQALAPYAPNLPGLIQYRHVTTPLDWEQTYGLTEGNIFHGEMALDQMLFMRPVPGFGQYRTPIQGLYLCGAGTHPGGGVTGAPGFNAAREILKDLEG